MPKKRSGDTYKTKFTAFFATIVWWSYSYVDNHEWKKQYGYGVPMAKKRLDMPCLHMHSTKRG